MDAAVANSIIPFRTEMPEWLRKPERYCPDPLNVARSISAFIESHADEAERLGYLPEPLVKKLASVGLYGVMVPKEFGGAEPDPVEILDAFAELAYADGSVAWTLMANNVFTAGSYARGTDALVEKLFNSDQGIIGAGQVSALGRADRIKEGYRISGSFSFGSGSREASWFMGAVAEYVDGKPLLREDGRQVIRLVWRPREDVIVKQNWDVMGLIATCSNDFEFPEQIVSADFVGENRQFRGSPFYSAPITLTHTAWVLGAARRCLDEMRALATRKKRFGRQTLIDNPIFQRDFAMHSALLRASTDNCRTAFPRYHKLVARGITGNDARADFRAASSLAVEIAAKIAHFAWHFAGSDILRNEGGTNRLQRCYRDILAAAQHRHTDHHILQDCGTVWLGVAKPHLEL